jgi:hypothetical protein
MVRKTVSIRLNEKLWGEFKQLVYAKHGDFYGALSYEVEQAIQAWLATHTQNHTKQLATNKVNPVPRAYPIFQQVKAYLKEKFGYGAIVSGQQIPRVHLVEAIAAIRGNDERTIQKWMQTFQKFKLIKWIAGEVYEVV